MAGREKFQKKGEGKVVLVLCGKDKEKKVSPDP